MCRREQWFSCGPRKGLWKGVIGIQSILGGQRGGHEQKKEQDNFVAFLPSRVPSHFLDRTALFTIVLVKIHAVDYRNLHGKKEGTRLTSSKSVSVT
jgi:hypothetical protein